MNDRPRRILVVDDDDIIRDLLFGLLGDEGYEVRAVADGREALDLLPGWRPDLILLDLMMPGMDGWHFRAAQRQGGDFDIPVLILSATRDLSQHLEPLGASAAIAKPFDIEVLLEKVEELLRTAPS